MDRKTILSIFLVLMALSLTLGTASADDIADNDDALSVSDNIPDNAEPLAIADDPSTDNVTAAGEEDVSGKDLPVSDLSVEVEALNETDTETYWNVVVTNNGPESAYVLVYIDLTANLAVTYCAPEMGDYLVEFGVWDVGIMSPNKSATVFIDATKMEDEGGDKGPYYLNALTIAEDYNAYDPNLGNNYDDAVFGKKPGNDYKAAEGGLMPTSNLGVDVKFIKQTDDLIYWSVVVSNNGPESADTTLVFIDYSDNLEVYSYETDDGDYLVEYGVWKAGNIPANESKQLLIVTKKIGEGPYYLEALTIAEDSYNTNLGRNYDIEVVECQYDNDNDNDKDNKVAAAEETLPATGNPIAVVLLALLTVGVSGFKRK